MGAFATRFRSRGLSHRAAARRFGIDPRTVAKMMRSSPDRRELDGGTPCGARGRGRTKMGLDEARLRHREQVSWTSKPLLLKHTRTGRGIGLRSPSVGHLL